MIVGEGVGATESDDVLGLTFGLMAAAFYAALLLLNKFIKEMDKLELTIIQLGTTALLLLPYVFDRRLWDFGLSSASIPFILIFGIVNTGLDFGCFLGNGKIERAEYCDAQLCRSFVAILISAMILQEQMTLVQIIGGVFLLGSTFVSEIRSFNFSKQLMKTSRVTIYNRRLKSILHGI